LTLPHSSLLSSLLSLQEKKSRSEDEKKMKEKRERTEGGVSLQ
jgi:hypothetical protein